MEKQQRLDSLFYEKLLEREREKFYYYLLCHDQEILIVKAGSDKETTRKFLGYKFQGGRQAGIVMEYNANEKHQTYLYDEDDFLNPNKVNTLIYEAFKSNNNLLIDNELLTDHVNRINLVDCLEFNKIEFEKKISLLLITKKILQTKWRLEKLGTICNIKIGGTPSRRNTTYYKNGTLLWLSIAEMDGDVIFDTKEKINDLGVQNSNVKLIKKGTTLISFKLTIGKTAIAGQDLYTNEAIAALEIKTKFQKEFIDKYLFVIFNTKFINLSNIDFKAFGKSLNSSYLKNEVEIPVPSKAVQQKIILEYNNLELKEKESKLKIKQLNTEIQEQLSQSFAAAPQKKLSDIALLKRGKFSHRPRNAPHLYRDGTYPFIQTGDVANASRRNINYSQTLNEEGLKVSKLFQPETILITIAANIGSTAILTYDACFPDSIVSIKPNEEINIDYLEYYLRTQKEHLNEIAPKNAQKNINLQILNPLLVPCPISREEQDSLIEKLQEKEKKIQAIEQELLSIPNEKEAILKKYL